MEKEIKLPKTDISLIIEKGLLTIEEKESTKTVVVYASDDLNTTFSRDQVKIQSGGYTLYTIKTEDHNDINCLEDEQLSLVKKFTFFILNQNTEKNVDTWKLELFETLAWSSGKFFWEDFANYYFFGKSGISKMIGNRVNSDKPDYGIKRRYCNEVKYSTYQLINDLSKNKCKILLDKNVLDLYNIQYNRVTSSILSETTVENLSNEYGIIIGLIGNSIKPNLSLKIICDVNIEGHNCKYLSYRTIIASGSLNLDTIVVSVPDKLKEKLQEQNCISSKIGDFIIIDLTKLPIICRDDIKQNPTREEFAKLEYKQWSTKIETSYVKKLIAAEEKKNNIKKNPKQSNVISLKSGSIVGNFFVPDKVTKSKNIEKIIRTFANYKYDCDFPSSYSINVLINERLNKKIINKSVKQSTIFFNSLIPKFDQYDKMNYEELVEVMNKLEEEALKIRYNINLLKFKTYMNKMGLSKEGFSQSYSISVAANCKLSIKITTKISTELI